MWHKKFRFRRKRSKVLARAQMRTLVMVVLVSIGVIGCLAYLRISTENRSRAAGGVVTGPNCNMSKCSASEQKSFVAQLAPNDSRLAVFNATKKAAAKKKCGATKGKNMGCGTYTGNDGCLAYNQDCKAVAKSNQAKCGKDNCDTVAPTASSYQNIMTCPTGTYACNLGCCVTGGTGTAKVCVMQSNNTCAWSAPLDSKTILSTNLIDLNNMLMQRGLKADTTGTFTTVKADDALAEKLAKETTAQIMADCGNTHCDLDAYLKGLGLSTDIVTAVKKNVVTNDFVVQNSNLTSTSLGTSCGSGADGHTCTQQDIIRSKAAASGITLTDDQVNFIVNNIKTNDFVVQYSNFTSDTACGWTCDAETYIKNKATTSGVTLSPDQLKLIMGYVITNKEQVFSSKTVGDLATLCPGHEGNTEDCLASMGVPSTDISKVESQALGNVKTVNLISRLENQTTSYLQTEYSCSGLQACMDKIPELHNLSTDEQDKFKAQVTKNDQSTEAKANAAMIAETQAKLQAMKAQTPTTQVPTTQSPTTQATKQIAPTQANTPTTVVTQNTPVQQTTPQAPLVQVKPQSVAVTYNPNGQSMCSTLHPQSTYDVSHNSCNQMDTNGKVIAAWGLATLDNPFTSPTSMKFGGAVCTAGESYDSVQQACVKNDALAAITGTYTVLTNNCASGYRPLRGTLGGDCIPDTLPKSNDTLLNQFIVDYLGNTGHLNIGSALTGATSAIWSTTQKHCQDELNGGGTDVLCNAESGLGYVGVSTSTPYGDKTDAVIKNSKIAVLQSVFTSPDVVSQYIDLATGDYTTKGLSIQKSIDAQAADYRKRVVSNTGLNGTIAADQFASDAQLVNVYNHATGSKLSLVPPSVTDQVQVNGQWTDMVTAGAHAYQQQNPILSTLGTIVAWPTLVTDAVTGQKAGTTAAKGIFEGMRVLSGSPIFSPDDPTQQYNRVTGTGADSMASLLNAAGVPYDPTTSFDPQSLSYLDQAKVIWAAKSIQGEQQAVSTNGYQRVASTGQQAGAMVVGALTAMAPGGIVAETGVMAAYDALSSSIVQATTVTASKLMADQMNTYMKDHPTDLATKQQLHQLNNQIMTAEVTQTAMLVGSDIAFNLAGRGIGLSIEAKKTAEELQPIMEANQSLLDATNKIDEEAARGLVENDKRVMLAAVSKDGKLVPESVVELTKNNIDAEIAKGGRQFIKISPEAEQSVADAINDLHINVFNGETNKQVVEELSANKTLSASTQDVIVNSVVGQKASANAGPNLFTDIADRLSGKAPLVQLNLPETILGKEVTLFKNINEFKIGDPLFAKSGDEIATNALKDVTAEENVRLAAVAPVEPVAPVAEAKPATRYPDEGSLQTDWENKKIVAGDHVEVMDENGNWVPRVISGDGTPVVESELSGVAKLAENEGPVGELVAKGVEPDGSLSVAKELGLETNGSPQAVKTLDGYTGIGTSQDGRVILTKGGKQYVSVSTETGFTVSELSKPIPEAEITPPIKVDPAPSGSIKVEGRPTWVDSQLENLKQDPNFQALSEAYSHVDPEGKPDPLVEIKQTGIVKVQTRLVAKPDAPVEVVQAVEKVNSILDQTEMIAGKPLRLGQAQDVKDSLDAWMKGTNNINVRPPGFGKTYIDHALTLLGTDDGGVIIRNQPDNAGVDKIVTDMLDKPGDPNPLKQRVVMKAYSDENGARIFEIKNDPSGQFKPGEQLESLDDLQKLAKNPQGMVIVTTTDSTGFLYAAGKNGYIGDTADPMAAWYKDIVDNGNHLYDELHKYEGRRWMVSGQEVTLNNITSAQRQRTFNGLSNSQIERATKEVSSAQSINDFRDLWRTNKSGSGLLDYRGIPRDESLARNTYTDLIDQQIKATQFSDVAARDYLNQLKAKLQGTQSMDEFLSTLQKGMNTDSIQDQTVKDTVNELGIRNQTAESIWNKRGTLVPGSNVKLVNGDIQLAARTATTGESPSSVIDKWVTDSEGRMMLRESGEADIVLSGKSVLDTKFSLSQQSTDIGEIFHGTGETGSPPKISAYLKTNLTGGTISGLLKPQTVSFGSDVRTALESTLEKFKSVGNTLSGRTPLVAMVDDGRPPTQQLMDVLGGLENQGHQTKWLGVVNGDEMKIYTVSWDGENPKLEPWSVKGNGGTYTDAGEWQSQLWGMNQDKNIGFEYNAANGVTPDNLTVVTYKLEQFDPTIIPDALPIGLTSETSMADDLGQGVERWRGFAVNRDYGSGAVDELQNRGFSQAQAETIVSHANEGPLVAVRTVDDGVDIGEGRYIKVENEQQGVLCASTNINVCNLSKDRTPEQMAAGLKQKLDGTTGLNDEVVVRASDADGVRYQFTYDPTSKAVTTTAITADNVNDLIFNRNLNQALESIRVKGEIDRLATTEKETVDTLFADLRKQTATLPTNSQTRQELESLYTDTIAQRNSTIQLQQANYSKTMVSGDTAYYNAVADQYTRLKQLATRLNQIGFEADSVAQRLGVDKELMSAADFQALMNRNGAQDILLKIQPSRINQGLIDFSNTYTTNAAETGTGRSMIAVNYSGNDKSFAQIGAFQYTPTTGPVARAVDSITWLASRPVVSAIKVVGSAIDTSVSRLVLDVTHTNLSAVSLSTANQFDLRGLSGGNGQWSTASFIASFIPHTSAANWFNQMQALQNGRNNISVEDGDNGDTPGLVTLLQEKGLSQSLAIVWANEPTAAPAANAPAAVTGSTKSTQNPFITWLKGEQKMGAFSVAYITPSDATAQKVQNRLTQAATRFGTIVSSWYQSYLENQAKKSAAQPTTQFNPYQTTAQPAAASANSTQTQPKGEGLVQTIRSWYTNLNQKSSSQVNIYRNSNQPETVTPVETNTLTNAPTSQPAETVVNPSDLHDGYTWLQAHITDANRTQYTQLQNALAFYAAKGIVISGDMTSEKGIMAAVNGLWDLYGRTQWWGRSTGGWSWVNGTTGGKMIATRMLPVALTCTTGGLSNIIYLYDVARHIAQAADRHSMRSPEWLANVGWSGQPVAVAPTIPTTPSLSDTDMVNNAIEKLGIPSANQATIRQQALAVTTATPNLDQTEIEDIVANLWDQQHVLTPDQLNTTDEIVLSKHLAGSAGQSEASVVTKAQVETALHDHYAQALVNLSALHLPPDLTTYLEDIARHELEAGKSEADVQKDLVDLLSQMVRGQLTHINWTLGFPELSQGEVGDYLNQLAKDAINEANRQRDLDAVRALFNNVLPLVEIPQIEEPSGKALGQLATDQLQSSQTQAWADTKDAQTQGISETNRQQVVARLSEQQEEIKNEVQLAKTLDPSLTDDDIGSMNPIIQQLDAIIGPIVSRYANQDMTRADVRQRMLNEIWQATGHLTIPHTQAETPVDANRYSETDQVIIATFMKAIDRYLQKPITLDQFTDHRHERIAFEIALTTALKQHYPDNRALRADLNQLFNQNQLSLSSSMSPIYGLLQAVQGNLPANLYQQLTDLFNNHLVTQDENVTSQIFDQNTLAQKVSYIDQLDDLLNQTLQYLTDHLPAATAPSKNMVEAVVQQSEISFTVSDDEKDLVDQDLDEAVPLAQTEPVIQWDPATHTEFGIAVSGVMIGRLNNQWIIQRDGDQLSLWADGFPVNTGDSLLLRPAGGTLIINSPDGTYVIYDYRFGPDQSLIMTERSQGVLTRDAVGQVDIQPNTMGTAPSTQRSPLLVRTRLTRTPRQTLLSRALQPLQTRMKAIELTNNLATAIEVSTDQQNAERMLIVDQPVNRFNYHPTESQFVADVTNRNLVIQALDRTGLTETHAQTLGMTATAYETLISEMCQHAYATYIQWIDDQTILAGDLYAADPVGNREQISRIVDSLPQNLVAIPIDDIAPATSNSAAELLAQFKALPPKIEALPQRVIDAAEVEIAIVGNRLIPAPAKGPAKMSGSSTAKPKQQTASRQASARFQRNTWIENVMENVTAETSPIFSPIMPAVTLALQTAPNLDQSIGQAIGQLPALLREALPFLNQLQQRSNVAVPQAQSNKQIEKTAQQTLVHFQAGQAPVVQGTLPIATTVQNGRMATDISLQRNIVMDVLRRLQSIAQSKERDRLIKRYENYLVQINNGQLVSLPMYYHATSTANFQQIIDAGKIESRNGQMFGGVWASTIPEIGSGTTDYGNVAFGFSSEIELADRSDDRCISCNNDGRTWLSLDKDLTLNSQVVGTIVTDDASFASITTLLQTQTDKPWLAQLPVVTATESMLEQEMLFDAKYLYDRGNMVRYAQALPILGGVNIFNQYKAEHSDYYSYIKKIYNVLKPGDVILLEDTGYGVITQDSQGVLYLEYYDRGIPVKKPLVALDSMKRADKTGNYISMSLEQLIFHESGDLGLLGIRVDANRIQQGLDNLYLMLANGEYEVVTDELGKGVIRNSIVVTKLDTNESQLVHAPTSPAQTAVNSVGLNSNPLLQPWDAAEERQTVYNTLLTQIQNQATDVVIESHKNSGYFETVGDDAIFQKYIGVSKWSEVNSKWNEFNQPRTYLNVKNVAQGKTQLMFSTGLPSSDASGRTGSLSIMVTLPTTVANQLVQQAQYDPWVMFALMYRISGNQPVQAFRNDLYQKRTGGKGYVTDEDMGDGLIETGPQLAIITYTQVEQTVTGTKTNLLGKTIPTQSKQLVMVPHLEMVTFPVVTITPTTSSSVNTAKNQTNQNPTKLGGFSWLGIGTALTTFAHTLLPGIMPVINPYMIQTWFNNLPALPSWIKWNLQKAVEKIWPVNSVGLTQSGVDTYINSNLRLKTQLGELKAFDESAHKDPLTGLGNRRELDRQMKARLAEVARGKSMTLVSIELDNFKKVNDTYGHDRGDAVLQQLATILKNTLRNEDVITRVGGDEFVLLLSPTDAAAVTERIRQAIETGLSETKTTASLGVVVVTPDLYQQAKDALPAKLQTDETIAKVMVGLGDAGVNSGKKMGKNVVQIYGADSFSVKPLDVGATADDQAVNGVITQLLVTSGQSQPMAISEVEKPTVVDPEMFLYTQAWNVIQSALEQTESNGWYSIPWLRPFLLNQAMQRIQVNLASIIDTAHTLSLTDALTGLPNQAAFVQDLSMELNTYSRTGKPMSMITIDLDDFKPVNDVLGHAAGDVVLQTVSQIMVAEAVNDTVRTSVRVYRNNNQGDEFTILLDADNAEAVRVAERIRAAIQTVFSQKSQQLSDEDKKVVIGASVGVATLPAHTNMVLPVPVSQMTKYLQDLGTQWFKAADMSVYTAKVTKNTVYNGGYVQVEDLNVTEQLKPTYKQSERGSFSLAALLPTHEELVGAIEGILYTLEGRKAEAKQNFDAGFNRQLTTQRTADLQFVADRAAEMKQLIIAGQSVLVANVRLDKTTQTIQADGYTNLDGTLGVTGTPHLITIRPDAATFQKMLSGGYTPEQLKAWVTDAVNLSNNVVVLTHGYGANRWVTADQAAQAATGWNEIDRMVVFSFSMMGSEGTMTDPKKWTFDNAAEQLYQTLNNLGFNSTKTRANVSIIDGHSMGGRYVLDFAAKYGYLFQRAKFIAVTPVVTGGQHVTFFQGFPGLMLTTFTTLPDPLRTVMMNIGEKTGILQWLFDRLMQNATDPNIQMIREVHLWELLHDGKAVGVATQVLRTEKPISAENQGILQNLNQNGQPRVFMISGQFDRILRSADMQKLAQSIGAWLKQTKEGHYQVGEGEQAVTRLIQGDTTGFINSDPVEQKLNQDLQLSPYTDSMNHLNITLGDLTQKSGTTMADYLTSFRGNTANVAKLLDKFIGKNTFDAETPVNEITTNIELLLDKTYSQQVPAGTFGIPGQISPQQVVTNMLTSPKLLINRDGQMTSLEGYLQTYYSDLINAGYSITVKQVSIDTMMTILKGHDSKFDANTDLQMNSAMVNVYRQEDVQYPVIEIKSPENTIVDYPIVQNALLLDSVGALGSFDPNSGCISVDINHLYSSKTNTWSLTSGLSTYLHEIDHAIYDAVKNPLYPDLNQYNNTVRYIKEGLARTAQHNYYTIEGVYLQIPGLSRGEIEQLINYYSDYIINIRDATGFYALYGAGYLMIPSFDHMGKMTSVYRDRSMLWYMVDHPEILDSAFLHYAIQMMAYDEIFFPNLSTQSSSQLIRKTYRDYITDSITPIILAESQQFSRLNDVDKILAISELEKEVLKVRGSETISSYKQVAVTKDDYFNVLLTQKYIFIPADTIVGRFNDGNLDFAEQVSAMWNDIRLSAVVADSNVTRGTTATATRLINWYQSKGISPNKFDPQTGVKLNASINSLRILELMREDYMIRQDVGWSEIYQQEHEYLSTH